MDKEIQSKDQKELQNGADTTGNSLKVKLRGLLVKLFKENEDVLPSADILDRSVEIITQLMGLLVNEDAWKFTNSNISDGEIMGTLVNLLKSELEAVNPITADSLSIYVESLKETINEHKTVMKQRGDELEKVKRENEDLNARLQMMEISSAAGSAPDGTAKNNLKTTRQGCTAWPSKVASTKAEEVYVEGLQRAEEEFGIFADTVIHSWIKNDDTKSQPKTPIRELNTETRLFRSASRAIGVQRRKKRSKGRRAAVKATKFRSKSARKAKLNESRVPDLFRGLKTKQVEPSIAGGPGVVEATQ